MLGALVPPGGWGCSHRFLSRVLSLETNLSKETCQNPLAFQRQGRKRVMKITSAPNWRLCGWFASWGRRLGALPGPCACEPRSPGQVYGLLSRRPSRQLDKNVVTLIRVLIEFPVINPGLVQGVLLAFGATRRLAAMNSTVISVCTGVSVPNPLIQQLVLGACSDWEAAPLSAVLGCGKARGSGPSDP